MQLNKFFSIKQFLFILILFFLDFFSKKIIFNNIRLNEFITIMPFLDFAHIHNYGISFGLFSGTISPLLITVLGLLITSIVIYFMIKTTSVVEKWGLTLIISGAISNIFDRALNDYVLDFIYIHFGDFYWPAFNFADIYISIGIVLILVQFFLRGKKIK
tara:strand:+ start:1026 stop:1502 length:477 start_codon:yes stop_codon:yes gene_type:complete